MFFRAFSLLACTIAMAHAGEQMDVAGKVALVTGASRGIGEATARVLGAAGIKVVLAARSVDKLEAVQAAIEAGGGTASATKCDVTNAAEVKAAFNFATETYGGVDFVFANAGWEGTGTVMEDTEDDEIKQVVDINILGYLYTMKYAIKAFKARGAGAMIFVSSVGAIIPRHMNVAPLMKTVVPYGVTKAANDYTARIGDAYFGDNIRSYGILPGAFETHMLREIAKNTGNVDAQGAADTSSFSGFNPWYTESIGDPVNIGNAALAMFDNSTAYESGTTVVCDNDVTIASDVFYEHLHHIDGSGHGAYQFTLKDDTIRNYKGDKYVKKDEL
jgi:NAD(P)-dependent dehydrogenase (short-subunit alcohol dehydrogenase family)